MLSWEDKAQDLRRYLHCIKDLYPKCKKNVYKPRNPRGEKGKFLQKTGYTNKQKSYVKVPNYISHLKNTNSNLNTSAQPNRITKRKTELSNTKWQNISKDVEHWDSSTAGVNKTDTTTWENWHYLLKLLILMS